ncbi:MAG: 2-dehydro-3-deoxyphosphogluconate aldolase [Thermoanaerobaculia bacterium]|nr:2-dehydro-3-deoxyphosphogluconate aldolase [Thermoanaerobaculia bacterium]
MRADDFVSCLGERRVSAILRCGDTAMAAAAMERAIAGGFSVVEFTLSIPDAYELIRDFSRREDLVVGAGTVLTPAEAAAALDAGADFLVSPVVDEAVIEVAREAGVAAMPGTHTPTEMLRAHRAGAPLVKLFPSPAGGPAWVASVLGPLPFLRIVPTNGVDATNLRSWLDAGAYAAGFAATLFRAEDLDPAGLDRIEKRARSIVDQVGPVPASTSPASAVGR